MKDHGFESIAEFARFLGIDPATLGRYLIGSGEPTRANLQIMARPLGVTVIDLMIAAGLLHAEDVPGWQPAKPKPYPKEIREVLDDLDNDELTPDLKRLLLRGVSQSRKIFWEIYQAPREPGRKKVSSAR